MAKVTARIFQSDPEDAPFAEALAALGRLRARDRTVRISLGHDLFSMPDVRSVGLGIWTLRTGAGLDIFDGEEIRPWDLPTSLAEGSFYRFFDDGITVFLLKGHGPRTTALSNYFEDLAELDVTFHPIAVVRGRRYITRLSDVKRVELSFSGEAVSELRQVDRGLGAAAASLVTTSDSDKLTVVFDGTDPESRDTMWGRVQQWLPTLSSALPLPGVGRLRVYVRGEIEGEELVDLLEDKISYQMDIPGDGRLDVARGMAVAARAYARYRDDFG